VRDNSSVTIDAIISSAGASAPKRPVYNLEYQIKNHKAGIISTHAQEEMRGTYKREKHVKDDTRHPRAAQKRHEHAQRVYVHRLTRGLPRFRSTSSESAPDSGTALTNKMYAEPIPSKCSASAPPDCINRRAVSTLRSSSVQTTSGMKAVREISVPTPSY
jgi:hypothetical protein